MMCRYPLDAIGMFIIVFTFIKGTGWFCKCDRSSFKQMLKMIRLKLYEQWSGKLFIDVNLIRIAVVVDLAIRLVEVLAGEGNPIVPLDKTITFCHLKTAYFAIFTIRRDDQGFLGQQGPLEDEYKCKDVICQVKTFPVHQSCGPI